MSVVAALSKIQKELKVGKENKNEFGKYKYRTCSDILEAVKPLLPAGAVIVLTDDLVIIGERYYIKAVASLILDKETISSTSFARESHDKKGMDDSQITGSTSTYARKYALNALLAIDDTVDADGMDNTDHSTQKKLEDRQLAAVVEAVSNNDSLGMKEVWDEMDEDAKQRLWRQLNTKQKSTARELLQQSVKQPEANNEQV